MNILILQGPNLNLLGLRSSKTENRLTLDKLNKGIKKHLKNKDVELKIYQTHKQFQAVNYLQRNRKWASGIIIIPTSWARNEYTLLETINILDIPTSIIYFNEPFAFGGAEESSIMVGKSIRSFIGEPVAACIQGIESFIT